MHYLVGGFASFLPKSRNSIVPVPAMLWLRTGSTAETEVEGYLCSRARLVALAAKRIRPAYGMEYGSVSGKEEEEDRRLIMRCMSSKSSQLIQLCGRTEKAGIRSLAWESGMAGWAGLRSNAILRMPCKKHRNKKPGSVIDASFQGQCSLQACIQAPPAGRAEICAHHNRITSQPAKRAQRAQRIESKS